MIVKDGTTLLGLHPKMQIANCIVAVIYFKNGFKFRLTAGVDQFGHSAKSFHPKGRACDWGIQGLSIQQVKDLRDEIDLKLGPDYDIVLEKDHIHGEYDPDNPKVI